MSEVRFAKAKKVIRRGAGNCLYDGTITGYGVPSVPTIENISITTGAWTAWALPFGCRWVQIKRRGSGAAFRVSTVASGATYLTINAGDSLIVEEMFGPQLTTNLYFQSVTSDDTLEILYFRDGQDCNT